MIVRGTESADHELAHGLLAARLGIFMPSDPGVDRLDLVRTEVDRERCPGLRIRHIHKLMRR